MAHSYQPSRPAPDRRSVYAVLARFPFVCFWLALFTDVAYWRTENLMWHNFSAWLLFAGIVFGALAALAGIAALFRPDVRYARHTWPYVLCAVLVLVLAFLNNLVHAGDGWTAIVPWGLVLSAATVAMMAVAAFVGGPLARRHDTGVHIHD